MLTHKTRERRSLLEPIDLQLLKAGPSESGQDSHSRHSINGSGRWFHQAALTKVKTHAQEHNEAKPSIEEHAEVDNANDDVSQCGDDVEYQVARRQSQATKNSLRAQGQ